MSPMDENIDVRSLWISQLVKWKRDMKRRGLDLQRDRVMGAIYAILSLPPITGWVGIV